ncbi:MAG: DUF445 family protein [Myxococcales bacterium]|nr:DUF445 family protein [Myxococcales bacterium]
MPNWLILFITVPTVTAVIGWTTNLAAVKMIFHPAKFFGIGPAGWQGIIYKQGHKFATGVAEMVSENLITPEELASRFSSKDLEEIVGKHMDPEVAGTCAEIADELVTKGTWDNLPNNVRDMITGQVKMQTRTISGEVFETVQGKATDVLDIHSLVYDQLSGENVERLARLTKRIGKTEFKFIEYYGGVFGFLIGLGQVAAWQLMQTWWLMPIVGVLVGLVTNWLAIQMIFRPQEPTRYFFGLITYQGLFAKRQKDIARDYGETAENEILTPKVLIETLSKGDKAEEMTKMIVDTVTERIKAELGKFKAMIPIEITDEMLVKAQAIVTRRLIERAPAAMPELESYLGEKMQVRKTVEDKLGNMPKDDFEGVLRGIFEEDELTLIIVGGVLGGTVGFLQGLLVTSI